MPIDARPFKMNIYFQNILVPSILTNAFMDFGFALGRQQMRKEEEYGSRTQLMVISRT